MGQRRAWKLENSASILDIRVQLHYLHAGRDPKASKAEQEPEAADSSKLNGLQCMHVDNNICTLQDVESQLARLLQGTDETTTG